MKIIPLIFALIFSVSCNTSQKSNSAMKTQKEQNDFSLIRAYQIPWFGGRPNVKGVYYKIELEPKKENISFDSLYVKNQWNRIYVEEENPTLLMASIQTPMPKNGDLIISPTEDMDTEEFVEQKPASSDKNILAYTVEGKTKYFEVGDFEKEDAKMYP